MKTYRLPAVSVFTFAIMVLMLFTACTSGVNSMVEDYNHNFSAAKNTNTTSISIYDKDFSATNMLSGRYTLAAHDTLCLLAPNDASQYQWRATMTDGRNFDSKDPRFIELGAQQQLTIYVPDSGLEQWAKYDLTLTVYDAEGTTYSDTASLVVY